ncbi:MAG: helix-turn-helix transcriptional regulator [Oscillospiraceae bacterium]
MAREKFQTLTEQMFYILLCLQKECCGMDIMGKVSEMTEGRVSIGPGTLYSLLDSFVKADMIYQTKVEGRRRSYLLTDIGTQALRSEYERLQAVACDYEKYNLKSEEDF